MSQQCVPLQGQLDDLRDAVSESKRQNLVLTERNRGLQTTMETQQREASEQVTPRHKDLHCTELERCRYA